MPYGRQAVSKSKVAKPWHITAQASEDLVRGKMIPGYRLLEIHVVRCPSLGGVTHRNDLGDLQMLDKHPKDRSDPQVA
jgi:hypothetical protein